MKFRFVNNLIIFIEFSHGFVNIRVTGPFWPPEFWIICGYVEEIFSETNLLFVVNSAVPTLCVKLKIILIFPIGPIYNSVQVYFQVNFMIFKGIGRNKDIVNPFLGPLSQINITPNTARKGSWHNIPTESRPGLSYEETLPCCRLRICV